MGYFLGKVYWQNPDMKSTQQTTLINTRLMPKQVGGLRLKGFVKESSQDKPLISIIVVVFNASAELENTINSVINQPYENIELIIIDGGSEDNTVDVIKKYEAQIDYWESIADDGIYDAMNKGWLLANNDSSILYLGAGDLIQALPLEMINKLNFADTILYGNVDIGGAIFTSVANWKLRLGNTLHHQALLIPKRLSLSAPFDMAYSVYADYDFNARLYKKKCHFCHVVDFKSYALPGGVSSRVSYAEMIRISKSNFGFFWAILSLLYLAWQRFNKSYLSLNNYKK